MPSHPPVSVPAGESARRIPGKKAEHIMTKDIPVVAIVGRQNVGKSTLFNAIIKKRKAIVDPLPGLTRDVILHTVSHDSVLFSITDTPGLDIPGSWELSAAIRENAMAHLERASVIILLLENPAPLPFDMDLADMVRKLGKPVIVAVNKTDDTGKMENMVNFYEMGFGDIIPLSALNRFNLTLLMDTIVNILPRKKTALPEPDIRLSIVGRPNSGKSTLLNSFLGFQRSVVSDIPGTTRDSIDDMFNFHGKRIELIDTAGLRKKRKMTEDVEYYSFTRTVESMEKSDVVIHLIDAVVGISETDKKIADEISRVKKPFIMAINKWDTVDKGDKTFREFTDKMVFKFFKAGDAPIISISAKNKQRISKLLETAIELHDRAMKKIDTPGLNQAIARILTPGKLPQLGSKLKVYYAVQTGSMPPVFRFFVNNPEFFRKDVLRYFEKSLQDELGLKGIPVTIHLEGKKRKK